MKTGTFWRSGRITRFQPPPYTHATNLLLAHYIIRKKLWSQLSGLRRESTHQAPEEQRAMTSPIFPHALETTSTSRGGKSLGAVEDRYFLEIGCEPSIPNAYAIELLTTHYRQLQVKTLEKREKLKKELKVPTVAMQCDWEEDKSGRL